MTKHYKQCEQAPQNALAGHMWSRLRTPGLKNLHVKNLFLKGNNDKDSEI
jgi:hypothetical protein